MRTSLFEWLGKDSVYRTNTLKGTDPFNLDDRVFQAMTGQCIDDFEQKHGISIYLYILLCQIKEKPALAGFSDTACVN